MKNNIKSEIDKIEIPTELDHHIKTGVYSDESAGHYKTKKPYYYFFRTKKRRHIASMLLLLTIFGFVIFNGQKTLLVLASEQPVISSIFKLEPLSEQLFAVLEERDYRIEGISVLIIPKKEIDISLAGTKEYKEVVEGDIIQTTQQFLEDEGYDKFAINVNEYKETASYDLTESEKEEKYTMEKTIDSVLSELEVDLLRMEVYPTDKIIYINIATTTINGEENLREYSKTVTQELENKTNFKEYEFYFSVTGNEQTVDSRSSFTPLDKIDIKIGELGRELTEKQEYKVTNFSFTEEPLTFHISTSAESSDKEHGKYLEGIITDYLQSSNVEPALQNNSFEIIIYSNDERKIN